MTITILQGDCLAILPTPKSHDVSKGIDRAAGAERKIIAPPPYTRGKAGQSYSDTRKVSYDCEPQPITAAATDAARQWSGWGTALKPATEIICVARKPLIGTVAANVLAHGCGALNIDASRVGTDGGHAGAGAGAGAIVFSDGLNGQRGDPVPGLGRWPANVIHDGSEEVLAAFPDSGGQSGTVKGTEPSGKTANVWGTMHRNRGDVCEPRGDTGSAARFFYTSKADAGDRLGSRHPTVKPVDLMRYLVRLVTPPGGHVLDPFAGSGTTGMAVLADGFDATLIEREAEYVADIRRRIAHVSGADTPLFADAAP